MMTTHGQRAATKSEAEAVVRRFLTMIGKDAEASVGTSLYANGIGLDSFETAELSAVLEDALGGDPFSETATLPETLADVLDYYADRDPRDS